MIKKLIVSTAVLCTIDSTRFGK